MDKIILLILLSVIGSVTKGNAQLQCLVCINCPNSNELDSNLIQTCSLQTTTTTAPPEGPTNPPEGPTNPPEGPTNPPEGTTNPPEGTTNPPEGTTATPEVTTAPPEGPTIPTESPTIPTEGPPTEGPPPEVTTSPPGGGITTQPPPITPPSTTTHGPVSPPSHIRHNLLPLERQSLSGFECFVLHRTVGDSVQVNRGCAVIRETDELTCSEAKGGENPPFCRLCDTNGCNNVDSSVGSKYASMAIVFSSIFVIFMIR